MADVTFDHTTRRDGVTAEGLRYVEVDVETSADGSTVPLGEIGLWEVEEAYVVAGVIRGLEVDHGAVPASQPIRVDLTDRKIPEVTGISANTRVRFAGH